MKNLFSCDTNIGKLSIAEQDGMITDVFFENSLVDLGKFNLVETPVLKEAFSQLNEYLSGKRKVFSLPLKVEGSEFQKKVYEALLKIRYGETASYKAVAEMVGNEKASRAVGNANNKNPVAIFVPCHRVVGSNGDLVGFAGGLELKRKLLELENANV